MGTGFKLRWNICPLCQGVPSSGRTKRSNPHQPAFFQAISSSMANRKYSGLTPALPASIKLKFMKAAISAAAPVNRPRIKQMPAYHLMTPDGDGVTLVNIGVGPSNAKTITDHLAVLRPHCWLMVGHCGGLRPTRWVISALVRVRLVVAAPCG